LLPFFFIPYILPLPFLHKFLAIMKSTPSNGNSGPQGSNPDFVTIGLERDHVQPIVTQLNTLLADLQVYYQNLRGLHWNIKGEHFFVLHAEYEKAYDQAAEFVDMVAERIRTLDGTPLHTLEDYLEAKRLVSAKDVTDAREGVAHVLANQQTLIDAIRDLVNLTGEEEDEGTNDMCIEIMRDLEKSSWMFSAWLG
jgi:starvation-inducible DNA-binding protein